MKIQFHIRRVNITARVRNTLRESLERLQRFIPISASPVVLEHRWDGAPAFRALMLLVVPGPNIQAEARDHTLGVAWLRVRGALSKQIEQRKAKQLARSKSMRQQLMFTAPCVRGGVPKLISLKTIERVAILLIGSTVLGIGVALLVLPGPAFIVIPAGLAILAVEFAWARRWLRKARNLVPNKNGARGFLASLGRHTKNFLEWAPERPHQDSKRQTERKDKKMKTANEANQTPAEDDPKKDDVARRAYELYETRGREPGHELEDWLDAEQEVNKRRQLIHTDR
jgi:hypothetical protein